MAAGIKEFKERLQTDKDFVDKFKFIESEDKIIAIAKVEGYNLEHNDDKFAYIRLVKNVMLHHH